MSDVLPPCSYLTCRPRAQIAALLQDPAATVPGLAWTGASQSMLERFAELHCLTRLTESTASSPCYSTVSAGPWVMHKSIGPWLDAMHLHALSYVSRNM